VVQSLRLRSILKRTLRRVGIGTLLLFLTTPVVVPIVGGAMWLLWIAIGVAAPIAVLVVIVALLAWLAIHGWLRRDTRTQLAAGLLAAYLTLAGLLVVLAARGGDPSGLVTALIVLTLLLALAAVAMLGQGLVLERRRVTGWMTTALALLLIPLAVYLPFIPGAASGLTRALGNPAVYAGPIGWLTGCCPAAAPMEAVVVTQIVKEEGEAVVITVERTATPAKPTAAAATEPTDRPEPTRAPALTQEIPLLTAAPAPTEEAPLPTATPAPTTVPLPTEPYPLRRVFPETLYWDPEAVTGADGTLALDLELADSITTWRLTALASTQDGDVGVATYDIVVFQDFFAELDLPAAITQGETVTVTVTLYNYLDREQTVRLQPEPAEWYTLGSPPLDVTLPPEGIASATFTIRAQEAGNFSLQVGVTGEGMSDAIAREVTVFE
jgi:hypothetical protein